MERSSFEAFAQDSQLANQNLQQILANVESEDEAIAGLCVEALENCGPPSVDHLTNLFACLQSANSTQVYWAATLLGRLASSESSSAIDWSVIQKHFVRVLVHSSVEVFAKERIVWSIAQMAELTPETKAALASFPCDGLPRLSRLIHEALSIESIKT